ncbi:MAG: putative membrane protein [Granulosicoccus sp.]|jgi:putative membrane protein
MSDFPSHRQSSQEPLVKKIPSAQLNQSARAESLARYWWLLFCKGILMGAADVVPGVSGGTIAFITGIYSRLINALTTLHPLSLMLIYKEGFAAFWRAIDGRFLLTLFAGVGLSILSLAKLINHMLDFYPIPVWAFFFGLVLASILYLIRQVRCWQLPQVIAIVVGTAIAIVISILRPAQLPDTWWMMMFSGFIAICAMILPGISGSFILLLIGMYNVFIQALSEFNIALLGSFGLGCIVGLISFSHLLSYLLRHYYSAVMALLTGFLMGSLNVLWPWKHVIETMVDRHGEVIPVVQKNISPFVFTVVNEQPSMLIVALLYMLIGFLIVFSLDWLSNSHAS